MNRNEKCARLIALMMLALTMGGSVNAYAEAEEPFRLDFHKAHAFSDGDMSQIPYFEACAESEYECGMIAGTVLRERKRIEDAEAFYRKALDSGYKDAATSIANMHTQAENYVEGFAWSRLAYALDDPQQELGDDELHRLWSFRLLATNYQAMNEQRCGEAEKRSREVLDEWMPELHDKIQKTQEEQEKHDDAPFEIRKRVNPRYPRDLAIKRVHGFALVYGEVDVDGNLVDAIAMDYSDRRFERESLKAFSKWQFEVTDPARAKSLSVIQRIDFFIDE